MNAEPVPKGIWDHELAAYERPKLDWLWHGFLKPGNLTLLTSMYKAGKSTLVSHLLAQRKTGGAFVAKALTAGTSAVITEEENAIWAERRRCQDYGGNVCFFSRPFKNIPSVDDWNSLIDQIAELHRDHATDLLVVDPLVHFLRGEGNARNILDTLFPLRRLTERGMAVLLLHHPRKGMPLPGQAGRGHGSLQGHVDISIEMRHAGADPDTRARRFFTLSRHGETPRHFQFERTADGTNFVRLPDTSDEDFQLHWDVLRIVFEDATDKMTRQEILDDWPPDYEKPARNTLWRWLCRAVESKLIASDGTGRKSAPFRYWLPQKLEEWLKDPMYAFNKLYEESRQQALASLGPATRK